MVEARPPPPRPRTGGSTPHSLPSTPASGNRRQRQAVGFTNRSRPGTAAPAGAADQTDGERPGSRARSTDGRPRTSDGARQAPAQHAPRDDLFESHHGHLGGHGIHAHGVRDLHPVWGPGMRGSMTRPSTGGKPLQRRVRDKILKHCLNLGPVLRHHAENGLITPGGMRAALAGVPQLQLTNEVGRSRMHVRWHVHAAAPACTQCRADARHFSAGA